MAIGPSTTTPSSCENSEQIIKQIADEVVVEIFAKGLDIENKDRHSWEVKVAMEDDIFHRLDTLLHHF